MKIALAGNPNCGKTTMFNDLTGSSQYVGNWPGVTVEKKEGKLKGHKDVTIVDLPGIYSLSPYTLEEVVTRNFILNERPDVIINIVDASNIERNLYLTTQLVEIGIPVVIALNMIDIVKKNGDTIDIQKLSATLGCDIIETTALKGEGSKEAAERAISVAQKKIKTIPQHSFNEVIEKALKIINGIIGDTVPAELQRWYSIKFFERDIKAFEQIQFSDSIKKEIENVTSNCEKELDDDAESIITNERYEYISKVINNCVHKKSVNKMNTSDKIDQIVTNRWLALPIFALIMFGVYYIAVTSLGTIATDWINDTFFGEIVQGNVDTWLSNIGAAEWLQSLIVDGIIGGVGAVLGFVPQIMILFLLISILEDCGYMARVAFIMDRIFRKFGLSGKSFIPMLIGSGCSVPAVMASRTIENDRDRKMTIMLTPFIPCSAKLPIFALMVGALFPTKPWVAPSMYFLGIAMVIISGIILKQTPLFSGEPAPFVMELPQYHIPSFKGVLIHMWDRGKAFIIKAGTVIFVGCAVIWFLQSFNFSMQMVDGSESMLASIGKAIAPIFAPLGFGNWQSAVAILTGFLAKENVVATFGILFGIGEVTEENPDLMLQISTIFTTVSAYAFMVFNLFAAPCFAAIGAIKREMGSWKWTFIAIGYQTALAYIMAFIINQIGSAIFLGTNPTIAIVISIIILLAIIFTMYRTYSNRKKSYEYGGVA